MDRLDTKYPRFAPSCYDGVQAHSVATSPAMTASNLLLLHAGALGDFVLTLSVIQRLRSLFGATHVVTIASSGAAQLAAGRSAVDEFIAPDACGLHTLFNESTPPDERLIRHLRSARWIINFLSDEHERIHRRLAAITPARLVSIAPQPTPTTINSRRHITEQWCEQIRQQAVQLSKPCAPTLRIEGNRIDGAKQVLIHPGSGGRDKCWPIDRFFEAADIARDMGARICWMLGPVECDRDRALTDRVHERTQQQDETLVIEEELRQAARRIAESDLYLGNDAGMTHLAAAIGTPTIALFGPTDPRIWRPLNPQVCVISAGESPTSMDGIEVATVVEAMKRQLD